MDYSIKKMTNQDLLKIKDILISDFDDFWSYSVLKDELNSDNSLYFFIENNQGLVLGFIGIKIILDEAELMNIVVKKDARNLGIGSFLLKKVIQEASNLKLKNIYLEVNELNIPAINLYKKFNFTQIGLRKNYYGDNSGVLMKLSLREE